MPAGQGVAAKGIYYVPLRTEIQAVDIAKGQIKSLLKAPPGATPGNLVFCEDALISQSPMEISAYPLKK
jgi:hypothetical protein